jgi:hypothetical protein
MKNRLLAVKLTRTIGALSLLGVALAAVHLVPPFLFRSKMVCYNTLNALSNPLYNQYMELGWHPIVLDPGLGNMESDDIHFNETSIQRSLLGNANQSIRQIDYDINEITYVVSLDAPKLFLENEIYFPGWTAEISTEETTTEIEAVQVNDVFRGWFLPAGKYTMVTRFVFPYYHIFLAISLTTFLVWCLIVLMAYNPHLYLFFRTQWTKHRPSTVST